ncbi:hypothetical protein Tco_0796945 [Tanacetum coccineum]
MVSKSFSSDALGKEESLEFFLVYLGYQLDIASRLILGPLPFLDSLEPTQIIIIMSTIEAMAVASDYIDADKICTHCDRPIPSSNIDLHYIHCSRNLEKCNLCGDMIPKKHAEEHYKNTHAPERKEALGLRRLTILTSILRSATLGNYLTTSASKTTKIEVISKHLTTINTTTAIHLPYDSKFENLSNGESILAMRLLSPFTFIGAHSLLAPQTHNPPFLALQTNTLATTEIYIVSKGLFSLLEIFHE